LSMLWYRKFMFSFHKFKTALRPKHPSHCREIRDLCGFH
jgi:hypothetical protein